MNRLDANTSAIKDWLDSTLPELHPGSHNPEQQFSGKHRGESRVLLKSRAIYRLDSPTRQASHRKLLRLMSESDSKLATEDHIAHSALTQFVFGEPAGYQALLALERKQTPESLLIAEFCRRGIEKVLDWLEEEGHWLDVPPVPRAKVREHMRTEGRVEKARAEFIRQHEKRKNVTRAVKATAAETGYSERQIWTVTEDLRG